MSTLFYYIKNQFQGKYLDVPGGSAGDGAAVQMNNFTGKLAQQWYVENKGDRTYKIYSMLNKGYDLDVYKGDDINETKLQLWTENYNKQSKLRIWAVNGSRYKVMPCSTYTKALDVYQGSDSSLYGKKVQIYTSGIGSNQEWVFEKVPEIQEIQKVFKAEKVIRYDCFKKIQVVEIPVYIPIEIQLYQDTHVYYDHNIVNNNNTLKRVRVFCKYFESPSHPDINFNPDLSTGVILFNGVSLGYHYRDVQFVVSDQSKWRCDSIDVSKSVSGNNTIRALSIAMLDSAIFPYQDIENKISIMF